MRRKEKTDSFQGLPSNSLPPMKAVKAELLRAASGNQVAEVKGIIESNPLLDINWAPKGSGLSALHRASERGHHEVVQLLLGHPPHQSQQEELRRGDSLASCLCS